LPIRRYSYTFYDIELRVDRDEKELAQYKQRVLNYVSRIEDIRYAKQLLDLSALKNDSASWNYLII